MDSARDQKSQTNVINRNRQQEIIPEEPSIEDSFVEERVSQMTSQNRETLLDEIDEELKKS